MANAIAANTNPAILREDLQGIGSLITDISGAKPRCVGYLIPFQCDYYDQTTGPMQLTDDEASRHNEALSKAQIDALDHVYEIGQGTRCYLAKNGLRTVTGERIEGELTRDRDTVTLRRNGRTFVGALLKGKLSTMLVRTA